MDDEFFYFRLRPCDAADDKQLLDGLMTSGDPFELFSRAEGMTKCVSQAHHPKAGEEIFAEICGNARHDKTSYWEVYLPHSDLPAVPDPTTSQCPRGGLLVQQGQHGTNEEEVSTDKPVVNWDAGVFIEQERSGNLKVWRGSPDVPEEVIWESGDPGTGNGDYYTRLQGDGNLITYKGKSGDTSKPVWKTGKKGVHTHYFLGVECGYESVSIYEYIPEDPGVLIWTSDPTKLTPQVVQITPVGPTTGVEPNDPTTIAVEPNEPTTGGVGTGPTWTVPPLVIPFFSGAMGFSNVAQKNFRNRGDCNQGVVDATTVDNGVCVKRGGSCAIIDRQAGDTLTYNITTPTFAKVKVKARVASNDKSKRIMFAINGAGNKVENTPGKGMSTYNDRIWWGVQLPAGDNQLKLTFLDSDINICAISIEIDD